MIKSLYLGDPHIQVSNLAESERLLQFTYDTALSQKVDQIVILGDLLHTHAIIRVEVQDFWNRWLDKLSQNTGIKLIVLVGNHDKISNQDSSLHSLDIFKRIDRPNFTIVDKPMKDGIFTYMPYIHDKDLFVKMSNNPDTLSSVLVCHGTFDGSKYENGMYAPDGIDDKLLNFDTIITGHIHSRQRFGKVIIPGTARWLTTSDANQPKGLWLVDFNEENCRILNEIFIDTSHICTPMLSFVWVEGQEAPTIPEGSRATVELIGSSNWISKQKIILKGKISIKSKNIDQKRSSERKTGNSLANFLTNVYITKMDKSELMRFAKELEIV